MGIENLYIARVTDGLILVASMEHGSANTEKMEVFKNQAKQLLKKLNNRSAAKMSIESNQFVFQWVTKRITSPYFVSFSSTYRKPAHIFIFDSYVIENGICYLTLTDKSYNKRLAFLFLEEVSRDFVSYLQAEHGEE